MDLIRGTHTIRCLKELEETQWWPRERLEQLQAERLRSLIRHAYERVPYYRQLLDAAGVRPDSIRTAADLPRLPVLTKSTVRAETASLLADGFPRRDLLKGQTGGSTGTPLEFYSSREARLSHGMARSLRAHQWAGLYQGDRFVRVIKRRHAGTADMAPFELLSRRVAREFLEDCAGFSDSTLSGVVERMTRLRPRAVRGYASAICIIAEFIRDAGLPAPEVGAVVVGGEQLFDAQRALLRDVFGKEPFSKYGSFETFHIAMECEAHRGMHVSAEDLIVEIVDADGFPVAPGRQGRVVITSLHEYGMPLIRYDIDDESSMLDEPCPCGRALARLSAVTGKTGNVIYTPSGRRLSLHTLASSSLAPLGIRQFQFVQETLDHVVVRVVPGATLTAEEARTLRERIVAHYQGILAEGIQVEAIVVDRIEPTPAGKHVFLISRVKRPADLSGS